MQTNNPGVNPVLLRYLYDVTPEELVTINSRTQGFTDDQLTQFCMMYRPRRKDPQTILLLCLIGLIGFAGIHRFIVGQIGMGILYFLTGGLCVIGTIVDAVNYRNFATEYNGRMIAETLAMITGR